MASSRPTLPGPGLAGPTLPGIGTLPTGRDGRLLAAGILLVLLGAAWMAIAMPVIGWYEARSASLADRVRYGSRMTALATELPAAQAAAAATRQRAAPANMVLSGGSDPIAGAALESLIDGLTHDAGATLISTEAVPAVQSGAFRRIGLHVTARASWTRLIQLLAAIERAEPPMSIGNVQIQSGPLGGAEQLLDMSLSVTGFRIGTAAPSKPAEAETTAEPGP